MHGLLQHTVRILRAIEIPAEAGGVGRDLTTVAGGVRARVVQRGVVERGQGPEEFARANLAVYFESGTDVKRGDVIEVGPAYTQALDVIGVEVSSWPLYRKAVAEERQDRAVA